MTRGMRPRPAVPRSPCVLGEVGRLKSGEVAADSCEFGKRTVPEGAVSTAAPAFDLSVARRVVASATSSGLSTCDDQSAVPLPGAQPAAARTANVATWTRTEAAIASPNALVVRRDLRRNSSAPGTVDHTRRARFVTKDEGAGAAARFAIVSRKRERQADTP